MALKFGRSTPKTTDPKTGARIADLDVYGKITREGVVSSWPEARELYQKNKLTNSPKDKPENARNWNPKVKAYLSGATNILDDKEFEEPVLMEDATGKMSLGADYRTGSKSYNAMAGRDKSISSRVAKEAKEYGENMVPQFDSGENANTYGWHGYGTTTDINSLRTKAIKSRTAATPTPDPVIETPAPSPESMDMSNLRLKPLPAGKLPMKGGKLKGGPAASDEWSAPALRGRSKVKATKLTSTDDGLRVGRFNGMTVGKTKPNKLQYNREAKTSAAYFGDNVFVGEVTGKNAAELKGMKKETKKIRNESLAAGSIKSALALQKDIKQLRLSGGYAKKGDISKQPVTGKILEGQNSRLQYYTPELTKTTGKDERGVNTRDVGAMAGYKEDQAYKKQQAFSSSMSNMANRNTVEKQQAALSGVDSYVASPMAQAKQAIRTTNPGMSNKEVRQGARATRKEEIGIMKALDAKNKLKQ